MEGIAPYSFGAGGDACLLRGGDANGSLPQPYWGAHHGSDARGHRHSHNGGVVTVAVEDTPSSGPIAAPISTPSPRPTLVPIRAPTFPLYPPGV